jgi:2-polyprenyl-3-methyl-5-hydroxy-6-metoxy-1,4-benzoquinol methylase
LAALVASGFAAKWVVDEFAASGEGSVVSMKSHGGNWTPATGAPIAVSEFKKTMTVEELNKSAEHYFASRKEWDPWLTKPLHQVEDTPALLSHFAQVLNGLQLLPGMSVLDFGAGSCWASRWLTQLGMEVTALDVSETALKIGQALYARQPVIGEKPPPRFLLFDGYRIELPDASVDRILCLDTFHHLLNPDQVLGEMSRILKPGGIAGFSEPGPRHSRSFQSQFEMRNFKVLEDDVDVRQIWATAREVGFARLRLGVFAPYTLLLSLPEFEDYLDGGSPNQTFANIARARMQDHRLFFLYKSVQGSTLDSRSRQGLEAKLEVKVLSATVREGAPLTFQVIVTNQGRATWLPRGSKHGAVFLAAHLLDASGNMLNYAFFRHPLTPGEGRAIPPGETVRFDMRMPSPAKGAYILEFDLLSESVTWFSIGGTQVVRVSIEVT